MKRSKRMGLVLDLAQKAEEKAAQAYELANQLYKDDLGKLDELNAYYSDYESAFSNTVVGVRAEVMARQRGFLVQLSNAKVQQSEVIKQRESIAAAKKALWQKAHLKRRAVSDLINRLKSEEEKALSKKEEKMLDEWFLQTSGTRSDHSPFL